MTWSHFKLTCDHCGWSIRLTSPNEDTSLETLRVRLREHADEKRHYGKVTGEWESLDTEGLTGQLTV